MKQKSKSSSLFSAIVVIAITIACAVGYYIYADRYTKSIQFKNPAGENTAYYTKHEYVFDLFSLPTKMEYYILPPAERYEGLDYPLLVVLHGGTGKAYAAGFMAEDYYRNKYPGYVLVPVVPPNHIWGNPYKTPKPPRKNAMPYAIEIVKQVSEKYPIDKGRVYVVGCSMGGGGAIISSLYYQNVFAAAAAMGSYFIPNPMPNKLTTPLAVYHGRYDQDAPVTAIRQTVSAIHKAGGKIYYKEFEKASHNCPMEFFYPEAMWDWLYNQQKPELRK